jgi:hypothetical protein
MRLPAHGLHGFILAAQGLQGFMPLPAQGLHGFILAAQGLQGLRPASLSVTSPTENISASINAIARS